MKTWHVYTRRKAPVIREGEERAKDVEAAIKQFSDSHNLPRIWVRAHETRECGEWCQ